MSRKIFLVRKQYSRQSKENKVKKSKSKDISIINRRNPVFLSFLGALLWAIIPSMINIEWIKSNELETRSYELKYEAYSKLVSEYDNVFTSDNLIKNYENIFPKKLDRNLHSECDIWRWHLVRQSLRENNEPWIYNYKECMYWEPWICASSCPNYNNLWSDKQSEISSIIWGVQIESFEEALKLLKLKFKRNTYSVQFSIDKKIYDSILTEIDKIKLSWHIYCWWVEECMLDFDSISDYYNYLNYWDVQFNFLYNSWITELIRKDLHKENNSLFKLWSFSFLN